MVAKNSHVSGALGMLNNAVKKGADFVDHQTQGVQDEVWDGYKFVTPDVVEDRIENSDIV